MKTMMISGFMLGVASWGCSAAPPNVPPAPSNQGECRVLEGPRGGPAVGGAADGRFLPPAPPSARAGDGLAVTLPNRPAQLDGPLRLPALLSGHHTPTTAQWRALPNGSDAALIVVVEDPNEPDTVRARAVEGLAARGASMGFGALTAQVKGADTSAIVRRAAIRGLIVYHGTSGPEVESTLAGALDAPDPLTREAVVNALAPLMGKGGVRALLERRLAKESHALVKEALSAALKGATTQ